MFDRLLLFLIVALVFATLGVSRAREADHAAARKVWARWVAAGTCFSPERVMTWKVRMEEATK